MSPFERLFRYLSKPQVIVFFIIILVLLFLKIDKSIAVYFHLLDLHHQLPLLNWVTDLGLGILYIPTFLILALFFRYVSINYLWESRFWFLFLCVTLPGLSCLVLKLVLGRARPLLFLSEQSYGLFGLQWSARYWSLPSGHTSTIMGLFLGLSILFPRYFVAFILIGIPVSLTRVFLNHHYLSDVLLAAYLVVLELGVLLYFLRKKSWLAPAWEHLYNV